VNTSSQRQRQIKGIAIVVQVPTCAAAVSSLVNNIGALESGRELCRGPATPTRSKVSACVVQVEFRKPNALVTGATKPSGALLISWVS
jgi:hypothetical protein